MDRVVFLLEMTGEEAEGVIAAVANSSVRFLGQTLADVVNAGMPLGGSEVHNCDCIHMACSDEIAREDGPRYMVSRR